MIKQVDLSAINQDLKIDPRTIRFLKVFVDAADEKGSYRQNAYLPGTRVALIKEGTREQRWKDSEAMIIGNNNEGQPVGEVYRSEKFNSSREIDGGLWPIKSETSGSFRRQGLEDSNTYVINKADISQGGITQDALRGTKFKNPEMDTGLPYDVADVLKHSDNPVIKDIMRLHDAMRRAEVGVFSDAKKDLAAMEIGEVTIGDVLALSKEIEKAVNALELAGILTAEYNAKKASGEETEGESDVADTTTPPQQDVDRFGW